MKIILLSDVHMLGQNPIGRLDETAVTCLKKLEFVLKYAKKHNGIILQAGDFFDTPRNWFVMINVLELLKKYHEVDVFAVYGQHDTYMYNESTRDYTALGTLAKANWVQILGSDPVKYDDFHIYGVHFSPNQKMPKIVDSDVFNILVIHSTISDAPVFPGHQVKNAKEFLEDNSDFDVILCGDIHREFFEIKESNSSCICNTGPMIRKDASHYNFEHEPNFVTMDVEDGFVFDRVVIPHQPAEEVLTREHIDTELESKEMLQEFIDTITEDQVDEGIDLIKNIHSFMKKNKVKKPVYNILSKLMSDKGE